MDALGRATAAAELERERALLLADILDAYEIAARVWPAVGGDSDGERCRCAPAGGPPGLPLGRTLASLCDAGHDRACARRLLGAAARGYADAALYHLLEEEWEAAFRAAEHAVSCEREVAGAAPAVWVGFYEAVTRVAQYEATLALMGRVGEQSA
jgi:hypothetical protein